MRLRAENGRFKAPGRPLQPFNHQIRICDERGAHTLLEAIKQDDLNFWAKTESAPLPPFKELPLLHLTKTAAQALGNQMIRFSISIFQP